VIQGLAKQFADDFGDLQEAVGRVDSVRNIELQPYAAEARHSTEQPPNWQ